MTQEITDLPATSEDKALEPGGILRQTRETQQLSVDAVSKMIKVNKRHIEMMEQDAYPNRCINVYAKGYIRLYCRLLNISDSSILEQLDLLGFTIDPNAYDNPLHQERIEYCQQKKRHTMRRLLLLLLAIGIVTLLVRAFIGPLPPLTELSAPIPFTPTNVEHNSPDTEKTAAIIEPSIEPSSPYTDDSLSKVIAQFPPPTLDIDTANTPNSPDQVKHSRK